MTLYWDVNSCVNWYAEVKLVSSRRCADTTVGLLLLEDAARDCGATSWEVYRYITIPLLWPVPLGLSRLSLSHTHTLPIDQECLLLFLLELPDGKGTRQPCPCKSMTPSLSRVTIGN